jgi:hypothetical protein
MQRIRLAKNTK